MKKLLFFLTVFLFSVFVIAEEVQAGEYTIEDVTITLFEEREPEPEPEKEPEPEPEKEPEKEVVPQAENSSCNCDNSNENGGKPKFFYFQPALGFGSGFSIYRPTVAIDAGFLVAHTPEVNYYVGLDLDLWWPRDSITDRYDPILYFFVKASGVFDVMTGNNPYIRSVSLWISLGLEMGYGHKIDDVGKKFDADVKYNVAWGTGVDLVFRNYLVLKLGLDSLWALAPDCTFAVGYRF